MLFCYFIYRWHQQCTNYKVYTYIQRREWKEKVDQVEDFDADTLEFTEKKTFIFSPELSAPLTGDEELTMIHPLLSVRFAQSATNK